MAKPELGNKHQCQHCGTKFFDLNKAPIICPKCGTIFQALQLSRAQRAAVAEEEEDNDDVSGLIDNDIEDDEER